MTKNELIELKEFLTNLIDELEDPRVTAIRCTACVDGKDMLGSVCIMCYGSGMIKYVDTTPRRP